jgi:hypothetical protein
MRVLLDLSQLFFAARANKVVLNYAELLRRLQGPDRASHVTGFTVTDPKNARQARFLEMLRDLDVEVVAHPVRDNPDFTLELAMLASRSTDPEGITYVSGDDLLQRTLPLLHFPVTIAFFPAQMAPSWTPLILSERVRFIDLTTKQTRSELEKTHDQESRKQERKQTDRD